MTELPCLRATTMPARRSTPSCWDKCELLAVIVEVLSGVVVDVGQGHRVGEEGVPASGKVQLPREGGIGFFFDVALRRRDHTVHQTAHSSSAEDDRSAA
jgi:hypothetical protein